jgi:hypothetical protein
MATDGDPRLKLIYEESLRGLSVQGAVVDELRNRAGILLSAAGVSSAFLGAADLAHHEAFGTLTIAALGVFGIVIALCVYVLWPVDNWVLVHNGKALLKAYIDPDVSIDDMYRHIAEDSTDYRTDNKGKLRYRFWAYRLACVGLGVSTILWIIDLN